MLNVYVGYDPREAAVYHTFCQSVIERASEPVRFIPLHEPMLNFDGQQDGTNAFIYSRYLIPYLQSFAGPALFVDGDMVVTTDIAELFALFDKRYAVQVVKHDYKTRHKRKYRGTALESDNVDYPRKNWSSVMLWNCSHISNVVLSRNLVANAGGAFLHRFQWLNDDEIGELPAKWNHLVGEYEHKPASLYHYTLGAPGFDYYERCDAADEWHEARHNAMRMG